MTTDSVPSLTFSQRTGIAEVPPQLKLGEISSELRRLIEYRILNEIDKRTIRGYNYPRLDDNGSRFATDLHVRHFKNSITSYKNDVTILTDLLTSIILRSNYSEVFDLIEFFLGHQHVSLDLNTNIASCFVEARAAYRIVSGKIVAVGSAEQANTFLLAIKNPSINTAARSHLINSSVLLKDGDWAGSVRESIHAVESVAVRFAPKAATLGKALQEIDKYSHLHAGLKSAFMKLYGYTSDQEGIRHANVFDSKTKVDETDAIFMLGACASLVSYLIARLYDIPASDI